MQMFKKNWITKQKQFRNKTFKVQTDSVESTYSHVMSYTTVGYCVRDAAFFTIASITLLLDEI